MKDILVEESNSITTITLNRPETLNALTPNLMEEIFMAFQEISLDEKVKVLVLTGLGKSFCSRADLNWANKCRNETSD